jgi:hypothetical protein
MSRRVVYLDANHRPTDQRHAVMVRVITDMPSESQPIGESKPHYLLQFFDTRHLRDELQRVSAPFQTMAQALDLSLPDNPEKTTALRKLLEAKDCAVRAMLFQ